MPDAKGATRVNTGIRGLDEILHGGLPGRRVHLVQGSPGAGKTTLALQFLLEGVRQRERGLYISLSETREEVQAVAASHGWDLDDLTIFEASRLGEEDENTLFDTSEVELGERMETILSEVARVEPTRLVVDSCTELRLLAHSPVRYRRQILALKHRLVEANRTVLLLDNPSPGSPDVLLQSLAHGVLTLEHRQSEFWGERRRLAVSKMRGVAYHGGYHDYSIVTGGLVVFPRMVAAKHRTGRGTEPFPSGIASLDRLLGGGLDRGTSALVMGPSGSGKSTFAMLFARRCAERGERAAVFLFDEARETMLARMRGIGMPLDAGRVEITQVDPAQLSAGEFLHHVRGAVDEGNCRVVLLDSINGLLQAMPDEGFLLLELHELLVYLGQQGVLTLLTVAEHGVVGRSTSSPIDVSYLADTVILVRYFEAQGAVHKALSVMKKRTGGHEKTIREYDISSSGVRIGEPLVEFQGVLSGVPAYVGKSSRPGGP